MATMAVKARIWPTRRITRGPKKAAGGKSQVVGRSQDADVVSGKGLNLRADRQQGGLQPMAHQQNRRAEQQGRDLGQSGSHDGFRPVVSP